MFDVSITWIYVHIRLLDDIYLEFEEFFNGVLTTSDPAVILDPDQTTVVIEDEDSTLISVINKCWLLSLCKCFCV